MEETLNEKQRQVFDLAVAGKNVFMSGGAGVGKTFTLNILIKYLRESKFKNVKTTASTGVAATLIQGVTLHAWGGLGLADKPVDTLFRSLKKNKRSLKTWRTTQVLVIDEISMVDVQLFAKFEQLARLVRGNSKPFGGIQLIITGDFFQLPPVKSTNYIFEHETWQRCVDHIVILTKVYRQRDEHFVKILDKLKMGVVDQEVIDTIEATKNNDFEEFTSTGIKPTMLFATRLNVDKINQRELEALDGKKKVYNAIDSYASDKYTPNFQFQKELPLKVGAQVILLKNLDIEEGLVNGSRGVVIELEDEFIETGVRVKFLNGKTVNIMREESITQDKMENEYKRKQFPLQLAWATTIHRAQGQTLDLVEMDLGSVFTTAQVYVAISRATSLDRLRVLNFKPETVKTCKRVIDFYENDANNKRVKL